MSHEHQGSVSDFQNIHQDSLTTATNSLEAKTAVIKDHDPLKKQSLEVVPRTGVYGLVYRLHPDDEKKLDICEGVGYAYEREMLEIAWVEAPDPNIAQGPSSITAEVESDVKFKRPTAKEEAQHDREERLRISSDNFRALVYVDFLRVTPSNPWEEYIDRMNMGIEEALKAWGLPFSYVDDVIRPFIPAPGNGCEVEAV